MHRVPLAQREYLDVRVVGKTPRPAETTTRHCQPGGEGHTFGADSESEFLGLQLWASTPVASPAALRHHPRQEPRALTRMRVNRHSTVTHYQRPNMTHLQEGGTGEEVSEILFFSAKSKRRPSLIYSMQIIPVCLSIVARRKGVSATRRGGSNWTPISLLVGHPCKLFHSMRGSVRGDWRKPVPYRDVRQAN